MESAMTAAVPSPRDEAIAWAIRAHEDSFGDWDALADWLAADPRHAELYDDATIAAEEGSAISAEPAGAPTATVAALPSAPRRTYWLPAALAASMIAGVGGGWFVHRASQPDLYEIATRPGETREFRIGNALRVTLDGGTRLTLDRHDQRVARLDEGEALFTVTHDPARPFRLQAGDATITDVGTVFDVERAGTSTLVSVAQGAVRVSASGATADGRAGQMIAVDMARAALTRSERDPSQIGGWRDGRIDFVGTPLPQLADRVQRATGLLMVVAPALRDHKATGSVTIGRQRDATLRQLADVLGISIDRQGERWVWSKRADAGTS
jgi:transmembrane sensor